MTVIVTLLTPKSRTAIYRYIGITFNVGRCRTISIIYIIRIIGTQTTTEDISDKVTTLDKDVRVTCYVCLLTTTIEITIDIWRDRLTIHYRVNDVDEGRTIYWSTATTCECIVIDNTTTGNDS